MKGKRLMAGWLAAAGAAAMVSMPAAGQVATPPPAAPAPTPEYVPPPSAPAAPRPRPATIDRNLPAGGPMTDQAPSIPFKPLARDDKGELIRDEQGNLRPLPMPIELMALDRNPTVGDVTLYRLKPYLRERKATVEKNVIDNLDMVQQIDGGVIDRLDIRKKEELIALTELLRPLVSQGPLATDLRKRDLLTKMQTAMNQKIAKQYQTDLITEVKTKAKAAGIEEAPEVTKVLLYNSIDEVMYAYRTLLMETGKRTLSEGKHSDEEYLAAGRKVLEPLGLQQRQEELRKTIAMRPPPPPDGPPPEVKPVARILDEAELAKRGYTPEKIKEIKERRRQGLPTPEDEEVAHPREAPASDTPPPANPK